MRINGGGAGFRPQAHTGLTQMPGALLAAQTTLLPELSMLIETPESLDAWLGHSSELAGRVRWALHAMPLSVYVEDTDQSFVDRAFRQLHQWELASGATAEQPDMPRIRFRRLYQQAKEAPADIVIGWLDEATLGRPWEVGHAQRKVVHGEIRQVTISLIRSPLIDATLSPQAIERRLNATILHEIGHALGLEHSSNSLDVMYYRGWQNEFPTEGDCRQLQQLYSQRTTFVG